MKPYAKVLAKQVCGDKAKMSLKGQSNVCNNAIATVETQEDEPLEEEKEPLMVQLPMLKDVLPIICRVDTASCQGTPEVRRT